MASKTGVSWELAIQAQHDEYRRDRKAVIWKTEPRRDRKGKYVEKAPPDFLGVVYIRDGAGMAVAIEAKHCNGSRFDFHRLKRHQAMDLEAMDANGGCSYLLIRFGRQGYCVPWPGLSPFYKAWAEGADGARASVDEEWCSRVGWMTVGKYGADWLL